MTYISEEQIITFYRFDLIHVLCFSFLYIYTIYEANWQVVLFGLFTKFNFYSSLALGEYSFWTLCESEKRSQSLFSPYFFCVCFCIMCLSDNGCGITNALQMWPASLSLRKKYLKKNFFVLFLALPPPSHSFTTVGHFSTERSQYMERGHTSLCC